MLPFEPESTSELLRASHIVSLAIESATFGDSREGGEMLVCREGEARVRVERVLKGELILPPDRVLVVSLNVYENSGPRFVAVPGMWSPYEIKPGARFVVFSTTGSREAAAVLQEPPAFHVELAETSLVEIDALLEAATPEKPLPTLVAELATRRASFTPLFARYVAWRLRELLYQDFFGFRFILDEAETPETSSIFRRIVITEAYDDLMMLDPAPPIFIARLIWGSVRAIASGTAADLGSRILGTYIPNLLGMEGGLKRKSAATVFENAQEQRQELAETLRHLPDLRGRETLLAWLA
jgi:hypothetical protein